MNTSGFEVEQKYAVAEMSPLIDALESLGIQWQNEVCQRDYYFNHPSRDFAITDEAVRIRIEDDEACLTYKGPKIGTKAKTRKEIELPIVEGVTAEPAIRGFLTELGFREVALVSKKRRNGVCRLNDRDVSIAIDNVEQLGSFIELELLVSDESEIAVAQSILDDLANRVGLSSTDRRGYLDMLLEIDS